MLLRNVFLAAMLSGCYASPERDSEMKYGTWSFGTQRLNQISALTTIARQGGTIDFALLYSDIYPSPEQNEAMRQNIARAIREWVAAIEPGAFPYPVPNVRIGPTGSHTWIVNAAVGRSYYDPNTKTVQLAGQYLNQFDPNSYRVILHEMGHVVGLADTYSEPGYQQPIGQPQSIMNYAYFFDRLQTDDIAGVRALWGYLNGRNQFCKPPYSVGGAYENRGQIAFCI